MPSSLVTGANGGGPFSGSGTEATYPAAQARNATSERLPPVVMPLTPRSFVRRVRAFYVIMSMNTMCQGVRRLPWGRMPTETPGINKRHPGRRGVYLLVVYGSPRPTRLDVGTRGADGCSAGPFEDRRTVGYLSARWRSGGRRLLPGRARRRIPGNPGLFVLPGQRVFRGRGADRLLAKASARETPGAVVVPRIQSGHLRRRGHVLLCFAQRAGSDGVPRRRGRALSAALSARRRRAPAADQAPDPGAQPGQRARRRHAGGRRRHALLALPHRSAGARRLVQPGHAGFGGLPGDGPRDVLGVAAAHPRPRPPPGVVPVADHQ